VDWKVGKTVDLFGLHQPSQANGLARTDVAMARMDGAFSHIGYWAKPMLLLPGPQSEINPLSPTDPQIGLRIAANGKNLTCRSGVLRHATAIAAENSSIWPPWVGRSE